MVTQQTHTPSPSVLFYLYADRVIAPGNWRTGYKLPGKEARVNLVDLAATLFAVAFWNLREHGLLRLNVAKGKALFVFSVTRVDITLLQKAERPGLEGELLAHISDAGDDVYDVIKRWYGRDLPTPHSTVINHVEAEAATAGYLDTVDAHRGPVAGFIKGQAELEPNAEALATTAEPFAECEACWQGFKTAEATLYATLIKVCKDAIAARVEKDRDNND